MNEFLSEVGLRMPKFGNDQNSNFVSTFLIRKGIDCDGKIPVAVNNSLPFNYYSFALFFEQ